MRKQPSWSRLIYYSNNGMKHPKNRTITEFVRMRLLGNFIYFFTLASAFNFLFAFSQICYLDVFAICVLSKSRLVTRNSLGQESFLGIRALR